MDLAGSQASSSCVQEDVHCLPGGFIKEGGCAVVHKASCPVRGRQTFAYKRLKVCIPGCPCAAQQLLLWELQSPCAAQQLLLWELQRLSNPLQDLEGHP